MWGKDVRSRLDLSDEHAPGARHLVSVKMKLIQTMDITFSHAKEVLFWLKFNIEKRMESNTWPSCEDV